MADTAIEWAEVPTHPGFFASRCGKLRGPSGKVLKLMRQEKGGHLYVLAYNCRPRKLFVHRAVLLTFRGAPPVPDQMGRHMNDNPDDNRLENLEWGTRLQNVADCKRNRGYPRGERKGNHILTCEDVAAIRRDSRASRLVAADYGVSHTAIQRIRRGERWAAA